MAAKRCLFTIYLRPFSAVKPNFGMKNGHIFEWPLIFAAFLAQAVDNPLKIPLEGAMVHYNGTYYAMSAAENGQMLVSENLVDWRAAPLIVSGKAAGTYELIYRNGLFYLYQWGGIAVSDHPLNPFSIFRKTGLSGRAMRLYQDAGGFLLSVFQQKKSKTEGEIWLRPYSTPWKAKSRPIRLLDGRRGQWDSVDCADLGGPEIFRYRNNYYLLYAANHPGARTGLREIGVAVNKHPLQFENRDKSPDPVLSRNTDRLSYAYRTILPSGEFGAWRGRYTMREPKQGWQRPDFKPSGWRTGEGGFGTPNEINGVQLHAVRTPWKKGALWIRREFDLDSGIPKTPVLKIRHEGAVQVFLNGRKVFESAEPSTAYSNINISEAAEERFREKGNVMAVQARIPEKAVYRFLDFGLLDAGGMPVEPTVYGLDAPRLIAGPNGFEKWLVYQAWWNGKPGTGLDRVFFFDKELFVDGPTTAVSAGYHPPPAPPTFHDAFPPNEPVKEWAERWEFFGGQWRPAKGIMEQCASKGTAKGYLKRKPAAHYLFETDIRFPESGTGCVGVVAWSNRKTDLIVSINRQNRTWQYYIEPSERPPEKFRLPNAFRFMEKPPGMAHAAKPLHRLRVTKNGGHFNVSLNGIDLLSGRPIITKIVGTGVPGLYCRDAKAGFDGVTFTIGWDEHDRYITGWDAAADGTAHIGAWRLCRHDGLEQRAHVQPAQTFKGDLLQQYEFTANARLDRLEEEDRKRRYGVFPVFADRNNYLQAMIDTRARQLVVSGKINGRAVRPVHKALRTQAARRHLYDKTTSYRNVTSWIYKLRSESVVTGLDIRWLEGRFNHLHQEFHVPADEIALQYTRMPHIQKSNLREDLRFYDADEPKPLQQQPGIFNRIAIRPQKAAHIGFGLYTSGSIVINAQTGRYLRGYTPSEALSDDISESDTMARPQETVVLLDIESSYFFRCVKLHDRVIIELNGQPMVTVKGSWPASQVGLVTEGQPCFFNGITLMHLPVD